MKKPVLRGSSGAGSAGPSDGRSAWFENRSASTGSGKRAGSVLSGAHLAGRDCNLEYGVRRKQGRPHAHLRFITAKKVPRRGRIFTCSVFTHARTHAGVVQTRGYDEALDSTGVRDTRRRLCSAVERCAVQLGQLPVRPACTHELTHELCTNSRCECVRACACPRVGVSARVRTSLLKRSTFFQS